jgi:hypothetical protein
MINDQKKFKATQIPDEEGKLTFSKEEILI